MSRRTPSEGRVRLPYPAIHTGSEGVITTRAAPAFHAPCPWAEAVCKPDSARPLPVVLSHCRLVGTHANRSGKFILLLRCLLVRSVPPAPGGCQPRDGDHCSEESPPPI